MRRGAKLTVELADARDVVPEIRAIVKNELSLDPRVHQTKSRIYEQMRELIEELMSRRRQIMSSATPDALAPERPENLSFWPTSAKGDEMVGKIWEVFGSGRDPRKCAFLAERQSRKSRTPEGIRMPRQIVRSRYRVKIAIHRRKMAHSSATLSQALLIS